MKVFAMYLPQFHRVKENDEWWGEGFTEWTAVRQAVPLFENHYQPHIPLNDYYYDLTDKETMLWQTELMHAYGIDGMCFYHYWFKDGRKILEKPAENLLKWHDVNMPFCFCWANETWARSWSNIKNINAWAEKFEKSNQGKKILLEQDYGSETDWKEHFLYLLPFFKDDRYIKIDNKPLILLYKPMDIMHLTEMLLKWREWAEEEGLEGLYIIAKTGLNKQKEQADASIQLEPLNSMQKSIVKKKDGFKYSYTDLCECTIKSISDKSTYYETYVGYDTTPRRGNLGVVVEDSSPDIFKIFLAKMMAKSYVEDKDIIFVNAWNEWGEGMHLEPDKKYGYGYLEAVRWAKDHYSDYQKEFINREKCVEESKEYISLQVKCEKYECFWRLLNIWLKLKEHNISIAEYLLKSGYRNVALYGAGMLGEHFIKEIEESEVVLRYIIDQNYKKKEMMYNILSMDDVWPKDIDVIVVCTTYDYRTISMKIREKGTFKIIFLETILMELMEEF